MSRVATLLTTLRGWSWLCAGLAIASIVPSALFARYVGQQTLARIANGGDVCRSCSFQAMAGIALTMSLAGLLTALLGVASFVRLNSPRPVGRRLELLLVVSAPIALPVLGEIVGMLAIP